MSYATLLDDEGINSQFLIVLKPRRKLGAYTLHAGSVYKQTFNYGEIISVTLDGVSLTANTSTSLSASQFFYDTDTAILYVRNASSTDPTSQFSVAIYEIYVGTFDAHFSRVPTDSTKRTVYYEPLITRSPVINASSSDNLFGFITIQTSEINLSNATQFFEKHIYDSSFHNAEIRVYHWLDDLITDNVKEIFRGVCNNVGYDTDTISIQAFSEVDLFSEDFRNYGSNISFPNSSLFPGCDPNFVAKPIRHIYGVVEGFVPLNVDFNATAPTTTNNRSFVVCSTVTSTGSKVSSVAASPASTATRTYLVSVNGFQVGDSVHMDRSPGADEFLTVTVVGANYIEHTALSGGAMASSDFVRRSFVGNIVIVQNGIKYYPRFGIDYSESTSLGGGTSGFIFTSTMESGISLPNTFSPNDRIYCRVYGKKNDVTLSASPLGSDDTLTGNLTNPIVILVDLMKDGLGIPESSINISNFVSLTSSVTSAIGFAIPETTSEEFPTFKDIIARILQTTLLKLYQDNDNKWKGSLLAPLSTVTKSITDEEILRDSFAYNFEYDDVISDIIIDYSFREVSENLAVSGVSTRSHQVHSNTADYLHLIKRQKTIPSLLFKLADVTILANRLSYALGDRMGKSEINTKNRFFDSLISDNIEVNRTRLPGFEYDADIIRVREFSVIEVNKSLTETTLTLDDQKGIEDNSGSW